MATTPTAVVTGATAGIGAAFARRLAAEGYSVVLVGRDAERLSALAAEIRSAGAGVEAEALPADLATDEGCELVVARLTDSRRPVELLVNNAGFGLNSPLTRSTIQDEERLLAVNVRAVLRLTHAAVGPMVERGHGGILNVASVAAFSGAMSGSTYAASKAWVVTFTDSVARMVVPRGVSALALCPGFTRTEFHRRAGIDTTTMPGWLWLDADDVVRVALRDLRRGRTMSVPGWRYRALVFALRHLPRGLVARLGRRAAARVGRE